MQYRYKVTESRFLPYQESLNKMAENGYRLVNIQQRNGKVYVYWEIKFD